MKQNEKKREFSAYAYYDFAGIAAHLEDMARQGWYLEKLGTTFWHYRRGEPAEIRYAVVYFPKADTEDAVIAREQRAFWDTCSAFGWQLAAAQGQLQVFLNLDPNAVPIETDPVVQADNIHTAMKAGYLLQRRFQLVIALVYLLPMGIRHLLDTSWVDLVLNPFQLLAFLLYVYLLVFAVGDLLLYRRWHRQAAVTAQEEGYLPPLKQSRLHRAYRIAQWLILLLVLLGLVFWASRSYAWMTYGLVALLAILPVIPALYGGRAYCRKHQLSGRARKKVIALTTVAGAVCCMLSITIATSFLLKHPMLLGHRVEKRSYFQSDNTFQYEVYHDALPLRLEDLTGETCDAEWSCWYESESLPWLGKYTGQQSIADFFERSNAPSLRYTVYRAAQDTLLYRAVKESYFEELETRNERAALLEDQPDTWETVDAAAWSAVEAYQLHDAGDPAGSYLLLYADHIVVIHCSLWDDTAPTAAQMALVGHTLGGSAS